MRIYRMVFGCIVVLVMHGQAQDYRIDLSRLQGRNTPWHEITSVVSSTSYSSTMNGQPVRTEEEKTTIDLQADAEYLSKPNDVPVKMKIKITKLDCITNGKPVDVLPIGSVLIVQYVQHEKVFTYANGDTISQNIQKILREAVSVNQDPNEDNNAFGTNERKKVGEAWDIHKPFAVTELRALGAQIDTENISGTVTLKEVVQDQDVECMRLTADVDVHNFRIPAFPPTMEMKKSNFIFNFSGLLPVDLTKNVRQSTMRFNGEFIGSAKFTSGSKTMNMALEAHMSEVKESRYIPLQGK
jgi:hypothetical protein